MRILVTRATSDQNFRFQVENITGGRESREYDAAIISYEGALFTYLSGGRFLGTAQREDQARRTIDRECAVTR